LAVAQVAVSGFRPYWRINIVDVVERPFKDIGEELLLSYSWLGLVVVGN